MTFSIHIKTYNFSNILNRDAPAISDSLSMGSLSLTHNSDRSDGHQWVETIGDTIPSNKQLVSKSVGNLSEISDIKPTVNKIKESKIGDNQTIKRNEQHSQLSHTKGDKHDASSVWSNKSNLPVISTPSELPENAPTLTPSSTAGKWIPSRLRNEESSLPTQISSNQVKMNDIMDDSFPDLATADRIMAQTEEQKTKSRVNVPLPKAMTKISKTESSSDPIVTKLMLETAPETSLLLNPEESLSDSTYSIPSRDPVSDVSTVDDVLVKIVDETCRVDDMTSADVTVNEVSSEPSQDKVNDGDNKSAIKKKKKKDLSTFKVSS